MITQEKYLTVYVGSTDLDEGTFVDLDFSSSDGVASASVSSENGSADAVTLTPTQDEYITVLRLFGTGEMFAVKAGGSISKGDKIEVNGSGEAVTYADGVCVGVAAEAASDGGFFSAVSFALPSNTFSGTINTANDIVVENGLIVDNPVA